MYHKLLINQPSTDEGVLSDRQTRSRNESPLGQEVWETWKEAREERWQKGQDQGLTAVPVTKQVTRTLGEVLGNRQSAGRDQNEQQRVGNKELFSVRGQPAAWSRFQYRDPSLLSIWKVRSGNVQEIRVPRPCSLLKMSLRHCEDLLPSLRSFIVKNWA